MLPSIGKNTKEHAGDRFTRKCPGLGSKRPRRHRKHFFHLKTEAHLRLLRESVNDKQFRQENLAKPMFGVNGLHQKNRNVCLRLTQPFSFQSVITSAMFFIGAFECTAQNSAWVKKIARIYLCFFANTVLFLMRPDFSIAAMTAFIYPASNDASASCS